MKVDAPQWLKDRLLFQRQDRGKAYAVSVVQGFLELPDWAYHLYAEDGTSLLQHADDLQKLFESLFAAATDPEQQHRVRIIQNGRANHFIMASGPGIVQHLEGTGLASAYRWQPDEHR